MKKLPTISTILLSITLLTLPTPAYAITDDMAYKCLVGEVRGSDKETNRYTAHALRNRNTTSGVYGCDYVAPQKEIDYMRHTKKDKFIKQAWENTLNEVDPTQGATHWENIQAFGQPNKWPGNLYIITKTKLHTFYVELKGGKR